MTLLFLLLTLEELFKPILPLTVSDILDENPFPLKGEG